LEQIRRIRAFKAILGRHDPSSLADALDNFRRDHHPDVEIEVFERIAAVFRAEVGARRAVGKEEELVYKAVLRCSLTDGRVASVLSADPSLKGLARLERVIERWHASR